MSGNVKSCVPETNERSLGTVGKHVFTFGFCGVVCEFQKTRSVAAVIHAQIKHSC